MVPKRSRAEWREHVSAWKQSDMTATEYARRHGLNVNTFSWWRSELGREGAGQAPSPLTLVAVTLPAAPTPPSIEVALPKGLVVRVLDHADPVRDAQLVRALVAAC